MSVQRRRGQTAVLYGTKVITDGRGNKTIVIDPEKRHVVTAAAIPQRSARAEVPGQQEINITRLIVTSELPDVNLWSRVEFQGQEWDVVTPPSFHYGTRKTRHWSIDIRRRPGAHG